MSAESQCRHNVTTDELLSLRDASGRRSRASLPTLLSLLGRGEEAEPLALRSHQHQAWHAFLVQLGALVAQLRGSRDLTLSSASWRQALLDLVGEGGEAAWSLCVPDLSRPALLQPSVPEGGLKSFANLIYQPDGIDVVSTAKNHDVKADCMVAAEPEHWLYSLLTLQTMSGFFGRGNYGIARMNGGFASRPMFGAAPGLRWSERFVRDVGVWLDTRDELVEDHGYKPSGGHALLWLLPWDGKKSRALQECDPFFIEVCRRVRLREDGGKIVAAAKPTEAAFLEAKAVRGNTGDIWTPVRSDAKGLCALTVSGEGLSYRMMARVLFGEDIPRRPALLLRDDDSKEPLIIAEVLVRGQGKTEGYHERRIEIPAKARRNLLSLERFRTQGGSADLRAISRDRIDQARVAQNSVLKPALCALLQGGPDKIDFRDAGAQPWLDRLDHEIDQVFFPELWRALDQSPEIQLESWNEVLYGLAANQLEDAIESAPVPMVRRPRAIAKADLIFRGAARNHLPVAARSKPTVTEAHS